MAEAQDGSISEEHAQLPRPHIEAQHHEGPAGDIPGSTGTPADASLESRLVALEERMDLEFLRREARLVPSFMNFWLHFKLKGARSDPKSKAALQSVLWRVFSPGGAAAAGGGLLLIFQTVLLMRQNDTLDQQTRRLDQQIHISQAQANSAIAAQIAPALKDVSDWMDKTCLETEGQTCWSSLAVEDRREWMSRCASNVACRRLIGRMKSMNEEPEVSDIAPQIPLPDKLATQLASLTLAARPYRFVENIGAGGEPVLTHRIFSPERGSMLVSLAHMGAKVPPAADLHDAYVVRADFSGLYIELALEGATFRKSSFVKSTLAGSYVATSFRCANMSGADLRKAHFYSADFYLTDLSETRLPNAASLLASSLAFTKFDRAITSESDFLDLIANRVPEGFKREEWEIKEIKLADESEPMYEINSVEPEKTWLPTDYCNTDSPVVMDASALPRLFEPSK